MSLGVCIGRYSPVHFGHMRNLDELQKLHGTSGSLVLLGSANAPLTSRNMFTYVERRSWIRTIYPNLRVAPLPDFGNDHDWVIAVQDIVRLLGVEMDETVFYGGCQEDLEALSRFGCNVCVWDRYGSDRPHISATEVRAALSRGEDVSGYLHRYIHDDVVRTFKERHPLLMA